MLSTVDQTIYYCSVDIGWQDVTFKFDGFLDGLGELADKIINQLGLGRLMVAKQKRSN